MLAKQLVNKTIISSHPYPTAVIKMWHRILINFEGIAKKNQLIVTITLKYFLPSASQNIETLKLVKNRLSQDKCANIKTIT